MFASGVAGVRRWIRRRPVAVCRAVGWVHAARAQGARHARDGTRAMARARWHARAGRLRNRGHLRKRVKGVSTRWIGISMVAGPHRCLVGRVCTGGRREHGAHSARAAGRDVRERARAARARASSQPRRRGLGPREAHLREAIEERLGESLPSAPLLQRVLAAEDAEGGRAREGGGQLGDVDGGAVVEARVEALEH